MNNISDNLKVLRKQKGLIQADFEELMGIKRTTLASWENKKSQPSIDEIYRLSEFFDISCDELLFKDLENAYLNLESGDKKNTEESIPKRIPNRIPNSEKAVFERSVSSPPKGIPLIPIEAIAGYNSLDISVMDYDLTYYEIPEFKGAEFLIRVKGSSMYPKYNSGDIIACKKIKNSNFMQWNKVYVFDTEQGPLIKRPMPGTDNDTISLHSDNTKYLPFNIAKSEIRSMSLVIGVIRLE